jgi:hypothetical protein
VADFPLPGGPCRIRRVTMLIHYVPAHFG